MQAMLLRSIKSTLTVLTMLAIVIVSVAVLYLSISEHQNLYREAVKGDLDGLSENMSHDLVPLLANEPDSFDLTTLLLRLDRYENVKYAVIYNADWQQLQIYVGKSVFAEQTSSVPFAPAQIEAMPSGVVISDGELIAFKRVGDESLPLGYLLIVNDSVKPLQRSTHSLLKQVLPLTAMVLFLVIIISLWVLRSSLMPLARLARLARKIEKTNDYSLRVRIEGKEEVSELSRDINSMMDTINRETLKNKEYTDQLMEQQKTMERLANFDSLTGLPNRQFFMETLRVELAKAQRIETNLVLMYFDLDGFKGVNDSLGHETGDQLLVQVSERARHYLRDGDVISRLGGDEFLILLHNEPHEVQLVEIAERLVFGLSKPFNISGWEVQVSASVGIAKAKDSHFNLSEFVSNADIAMYRSKVAGRGTHTVFVPEMMEDNKRKLQIANLIMTAVKQNEFELFYQTKVSPQEMVIGFESLIRWQNESLGFVSPAEFIPIAEQSGKITAVTLWVLEQMCKDLPELNNKCSQDVVISVNLSALDIKSKTLIGEIRELFERYQVDPGQIEFEVTESAYLENLQTANEFFNKISELGSSIALDDFGTGYSSLGYLTQIHINTLKIDKQFVDNLGLSERSTLITKTIIEMAKQLNLHICAEGVETREQVDFLLNNGCHQLQGYLFSKPCRISEISLS